MELRPLFPQDGIVELGLFLPNKRGVVFSGCFGDEPWQIYTIPLEGGHPVPLPETEGWRADDTALNGDIYAVRWDTQGKMHQARIPAAGGKPVPVDRLSNAMWFCDQPEPLRREYILRNGRPCRVIYDASGKELAAADAARFLSLRLPDTWCWNRIKPEVVWVESADQGHEVVMLQPGPKVDRIPFRMPSPTALAFASSAGDRTLLCIIDEASGRTQLTSVHRGKGTRVLDEFPGLFLAVVDNPEGDILLTPFDSMRQARWMRIPDGEERIAPCPVRDSFALQGGRLLYRAPVEGPGYILEWKAREPMHFKDGRVVGSHPRGVFLSATKGDHDDLLLYPLDGSPAKSLGTWGIIRSVSVVLGEESILVHEWSAQEKELVSTTTLLSMNQGTRIPFNEDVFLPHPDGRRALCRLKGKGPDGQDILAWFDMKNVQRKEEDLLNIPAEFDPNAWISEGKELAGHFHRGPNAQDLCAVDPITGAMRIIKTISVPQSAPVSLMVHDFDGESCIYAWIEPAKGRLYLIKGAFR